VIISTYYVYLLYMFPRKESELIQEIVDYIRKELKPLSSSNFGNLVEIGSCIGKVDDNEYFM